MGNEHDRLLSGRVAQRFGQEAMEQAAAALSAAAREVLVDAAEEDGPGLEDALDAFRLLKGLAGELKQLAA